SSPVIAGDFADPTVVKIGDAYYAAGTSSEWGPHYPVYKSTNLVDWKLITHILPKRTAWMKSSFWAPELFYHNKKLYAYYTVRDTGNISCIGVATADSPEKGFTDHGVIIRTGSEAIDAFVFNDDGQLYVTWKAYGLDKRPIELLSSKLSADGLKLVGETVSIKRDDAKKGMEGQSMIKRDGYYYLLYSAGSCCGVPCDYNVRVSRSKSVTGPFEEYEGNPILKENDEWMCTGHGTPVQAKDGRWFYLYHAYEKEFNVFTGRQALLAEITWNADGWPAFHRPANSKPALPFYFRDDFNGKTLAVQWSWDYRYSDVKTVISKGTLELSSTPLKDKEAGAMLSVRPVSGNYSMTTSVLPGGDAIKGLVLYGDVESMLGITLKGNDIMIWEQKKGGQEIAAKKSIGNLKSVRLRVDVKDGRLLKFYYGSEGTEWTELVPKTSESDQVDAGFTKQWDRAPRPGIYQGGKGVAKFEWFD
ncbi:MAG: beta-xylosidase, partial [Chitinophagaceae bacterium]